MHRQSGFTLVEAAAATAIAVVATGAFLYALGGVARFATHQAGPVRSAAMLLAEQTFRVAQDAWKYGSAGNAPAGTFASFVPAAIPGSLPTSAPVTIVTVLSNVTPTSATVTVTVRYTPDPDRPADPGSVSVTGDVTVKAPLPGSTLQPRALIPQPSATP